ncbi:MAG TPA: hypothetical protein VNU47_01540 [Candidatus Paceibacterota bacterium]|nr:hypothetical protein [Candidatus Paceibacterota bacterium]
MSDKGQNKETKTLKTQTAAGGFDTFVLEKSIFSNVFEKDIKRIYIYKKAERLAKAIHLIAPAFRHTAPLYDRVQRISVALVDAAILPPATAREALSRELLALSSALSIARTSGILSSMNAELIGREAHLLLEEIADYEEPRMSLPETQTLAELARDAAPSFTSARAAAAPQGARPTPARVRDAAPVYKGHDKGHISDNAESVAEPRKADRREAILSVLRAKGPSYIKDISTVIRDVSEKTIQRELQVLVQEGVVARSGERRWTTYSLLVG